MALKDKSRQYLVGYVSGMEAAIIAMATRSSDGIYHGLGLLDEKADPAGESMVGYAEGMERGAEIIHHTFSRINRRIWDS